MKSHGNADEMNGAFGMDMDLGRLSKMVRGRGMITGLMAIENALLGVL